MDDNKSVQFLYLSQEECIRAGATDMKGTLQAIEKSFELHGKQDYVQPDKPVIRWGGPETEETRGRIMSMPSYIGGDLDVAGIKWIPSMPDNPRKLGQPRASAIIILSNPHNGFPLAIMDGTLVSAMRTGAATGVAAKYLARPDSETVGLIGAGVQSRTQLMAINTVFKNKLKSVKIFDLNQEKTIQFAKDVGEQLNLTITPAATAEEAVRGSDIFVTATMSTFPYIQGEWIKEGAFHAEISFWDTAPEQLAYYDKVVVDDWSQVKHHAVDVSYRAVRDHVIPENLIRELGSIVTGAEKGRESKSQKILFNPIGMSIHDVSEAYRLYTNAKKMGIGQTLTLWDQPKWV